MTATPAASMVVDGAAQPAPASCYHCGLPVPAGARFSVVIEGAARPMCCKGCEAVAQAIVDAGLDDYYRLRDRTPGAARETVPAFLRQAEIYDHPDVQKSFVHAEGNLREASLILEGIVCAACVWLNERHLAQLPGVVEARINFATHRARVRWDDSRIHLSEILQAIQSIGYLAHPYDPSRAQQVLEKERRQHLRRLGVAAGFGMQVMMLAAALYAGAWSGIEAEFETLFHWASLFLTLPVIGYSAVPFFTSAWRDLRNGRAGMDVPVSLGIGIAFSASVWATYTGRGDVYFDSVAMFVFFLLAGRYFELSARKYAAEASEKLVQAGPEMATRLGEGGAEELVPVAQLQAGDRLLVRPGQAIPADGRVTQGRSSVDESLLTGESRPLAKTASDPLVGGSINIESPLEMTVERTGADTVLSAILRLLERAQADKPRISRLADRAAAWLVSIVLVITGLVAWYWWQSGSALWLPIAISMLVVTCPCALSLATPTAITAATGSLMRRGLLTARGTALEELARATHFVFDKTGTLTVGRPRLLGTRTYAALDERQCLDIAAALETRSEHPIARALLAAAGNGRPQAQDIASLPGNGVAGHVAGVRYVLGTPEFVEAQTGRALEPAALDALRADGDSLVLLADAAQLLAAFTFGDAVRPEAAGLVAGLRQSGKTVLLLTGDHERAARRVAQTVGIDDVRYGLKPDDKLRAVEALQAQGAIVAAIGDGVNDAAALARAHVSVAIGSGTQLAAASADLILLTDDLSQLGHAVGVAGRTLRIIRQNVLRSAVYNAIALPAAALGYVAPWLAAIGMSLSSLVVVANALRLVERRREG